MLEACGVHEDGELLMDAGQKLARVGISLVEGVDAALLGVERATAACHALTTLERRLDLLELDAVAHVLDLVVLAPAEEEVAVAVVCAHVACTVHDLGKRLLQGIAHEGALGLFAGGVIAQRHRGTTHANLALDAGLCDEAVVAVEQHHLSVDEGTS